MKMQGLVYRNRLDRQSPHNRLSTCNVTASVKVKLEVVPTDMELALALLVPTPQVIGTPKSGTSHRMIDLIRSPVTGCEASRSPRWGSLYSKNSKSADPAPSERYPKLGHSNFLAYLQ